MNCKFDKNKNEFNKQQAKLVNHKKMGNSKRKEKKNEILRPNQYACKTFLSFHLAFYGQGKM